MPKLEKASMKYLVSFNTSWGGDEFGDESANSEDYHGDDIDTLAEEVCASDPSFPMKFVLNEDKDNSTIGWFMSDDDPDYSYKVAVMVLTSMW